MKNKKLRKKLTLKRETISNLGRLEQSKILGGRCPASDLACTDTCQWCGGGPVMTRFTYCMPICWP